MNAEKGRGEGFRLSRLFETRRRGQQMDFTLPGQEGQLGPYPQRVAQAILQDTTPKAMEDAKKEARKLSGRGSKQDKLVLYASIKANEGNIALAAGALANAPKVPLGKQAEIMWHAYRHAYEFLQKEIADEERLIPDYYDSVWIAPERDDIRNIVRRQKVETLAKIERLKIATADFQDRWTIYQPNVIDQ